MFFDSIAYAQDVPAQGQGPNMLGGIMPMIIIFIIFYFLLIRPQQKRAKEHKIMLSELKRGDKVLTGGGIYGRIQSIKDDVITVEIAENMTIQVNRGYISALADPKEAKPES